MFDTQGVERKVRYVNYCLINLRNQYLPPYNSSRHVASVYYAVPGNSLAIDLIVPADESLRNLMESPDFNSVVNQIRDYYLSVRSDPDFILIISLFF